MNLVMIDTLVRNLENKYGVLDGDGELTDKGWEIGYCSYEIEKKNFKIIKQEFINFFKEKNLLR